MLTPTKSALAGFALGLAGLALIACTAVDPVTDQPVEIDHTSEFVPSDQNDFSPTVVGDPVPVIEPETGYIHYYIDGELIHEDDERWDCRFHGNQMCGVNVEGIWYLIQFEDGTPLSVSTRPVQ